MSFAWGEEGIYGPLNDVTPVKSADGVTHLSVRGCVSDMRFYTRGLDRSIYPGDRRVIGPQSDNVYGLLHSLWKTARL
jgi:hypothetical protein